VLVAACGEAEVASVTALFRLTSAEDGKDGNKTLAEEGNEPAILVAAEFETELGAGQLKGSVASNEYASDDTSG
jgi:hypothetical protein